MLVYICMLQQRQILDDLDRVDTNLTDTNIAGHIDSGCKEAHHGLTLWHSIAEWISAGIRSKRTIGFAVGDDLKLCQILRVS